MTREQRIEAAARARFERLGSGHLWLSLTEEARQNHIRQAAEMAADLYPELMSDPPTGWVAPMEATEAMTRNQVVVAASQAYCVWQVMRDVHTKEQT